MRNLLLKFFCSDLGRFVRRDSVRTGDCDRFHFGRSQRPEWRGGALMSQ